MIYTGTSLSNSFLKNSDLLYEDSFSPFNLIIFCRWNLTHGKTTRIKAKVILNWITGSFRTTFCLIGHSISKLYDAISNTLKRMWPSGTTGSEPVITSGKLKYLINGRWAHQVKISREIHFRDKALPTIRVRRSTSRIRIWHNSSLRNMEFV